jgi:hypothetical protein
MTTIVSAFVSNINSRKEMDINKYFQNGKLFLKSSVPKIIFLDETMLNLVGEDYDKSNTVIIKINKEDIYLNNYRELLTNFNLNTNNSCKDTIDYIFTMCNKTEWIRTAILLNKFNTDNFIWLDFGMRYIFNCSDEEFIEKVNNLHNKMYNKIRVGKIWDIDQIYKYSEDEFTLKDPIILKKYNYPLEPGYIYNMYKTVTWAFAGTIIGGHKTNLLIFAEKMKDKCIEIIMTKNTLMWEVNIWHLIYIQA